MKIGIIIAIKEELMTLYNKLAPFKKIHNSIKNMNLYSANINKKKIILIQSGIGKVSSSIACTILINIYHINYIINIGSAGKLQSNINIFDIVIANTISYYDVNLKNFGYNIGVIPGCPKEFITTSSLRNKLQKMFHILKIKFIKGLIISGDTFINNKKKIKSLVINFPSALAIDMESAAISQVCYQFKQPFIIIKIISDNSVQNAHNEFKENINKIGYKSYQIIKNILYKLKF